MSRPCTIWCLTDSKPGHWNQLRGLTQALAGLLPIDAHTLPVGGQRQTLVDALRGRFTAGESLPSPSLILAAGHTTHFAALAARRARGGRAIVLMKPTWAARSFDLCLVPEHDGLPPGGNVLVTRGVLNAIVPSTEHDPTRGLILVGGPSKHHGWSDADCLRQIEQVIQADPAMQWTLTTSRRTPETLLACLRDHNIPRLEIVPQEQTTPDWVPSQLAKAGRVVVSEDSVSMVYEALTSGADVDVLSVPRLRNSRVVRGLDLLIEEGWLKPIGGAAPDVERRRSPAGLNEAARCAAIICERFKLTKWRAA